MFGPATDLTTRPAAPSHGTILIVDGCADDRELSFYVLSHAGYRILQAQDAHQAQRLMVEQSNIDVLITEFNLPGMNGADLAGWFRNRFPLREVLLVSDFPWEIEAWIETADWLHFLNKTMAFGSLAETVERLLRATITRVKDTAEGELPKNTIIECITCQVRPLVCTPHKNKKQTAIDQDPTPRGLCQKLPLYPATRSLIGLRAGR